MMRKLALPLLVLGLVVALASCSQPGVDAPAKLGTQMVVGGWTFQKEMTVTHSVFVEPRVNKTADATSIDATSGSAELAYTITVEDVTTQDSYSATVNSLAVTNNTGSDATVTVKDDLYCADANNAPTTLVKTIFSLGATIASGATSTFDNGGAGYDPVDVGACSGNVVDIASVTLDGQSDPAATASFPGDLQQISGIAGANLVDAETFPSGYSVSSASLTLGGAPVATTDVADGSTYTMTTDAIAAPGTYHLVKTISTADGTCSSGTVTNVASMVDASGTTLDSSQASIDLTCAPPPPPPSYCTLTVGYWKNHIDAWPSGYAPDDAFYGSGETWLTILQTPVRGRAYVQLAYQYVAAILNVGGDASAAPADVQAAIAFAEAYFPVHDLTSDADQAAARANATILDNFNNGLDGVAHCGD